LCLLAQPHLDDHVTGIELPLHRDLLAVLDLDRFLSRHQRLSHQLLAAGTRILIDPDLQQRSDLVLVPGSGLDGVPAVFRHDLGHRLNTETKSTRISCRILSTMPMATPSTTAPISTARVALISSGRSGQLTRSISARVSIRKSLATASLPGLPAVISSAI